MAESRKREAPYRGRKISASLFICICLILIIVLGMFCAISIEAYDLLGSTDALVALTFLANGVISISFLVHEMCRRSFSIQMTHWVFYLTFFVMAPYSQYVFGYHVWGYYISTSTLVVTNLLVAFWGLIFGVVSRGGRSSAACGLSPMGYQVFFSSLPRISSVSALLVLALSAGAALFLVVTVGISDLFSRSTFSLDYGQTANLIIDKVVRGIPVFASVFSLVYFRQSGRGVGFLLCSFALLLVADFPTSMARYNAAAIYGCIILLFFPSIFEKKGRYPLLLTLGLLLVFPAINIFRTEEFSVVLLASSFVDAFLNLPRGFCSGDYDAYSMLARAMAYVNANGATMGFQFLTAVLFFVPRVLWAGKGVGSGYLIAQSQGQDFANISCPLPAEGVMNFGIIGLLLFAIMAGYFCRRTDNGFWLGNGGLRLFYPFLCVIFFFVMRGDLLSSFAYLVGYFVVFAALLQVVKAVSGLKRGVGKLAGRHPGIENTKVKNNV